MSDCLRELQRRSVSARHPGAEPFYSRRGQPVQAVLTHTRTSCLPSVLVPAGHDRRSSVKFSARDAEGAQNSNKNTLQEAVVETVTSFLQDNAGKCPTIARLVLGPPAAVVVPAHIDQCCQQHAQQHKCHRGRAQNRCCVQLSSCSLWRVLTQLRGGQKMVPQKAELR